jgi:four helix bundle protein
MNYDLEERVAKFGESIISFCQSIKYNDINKPLTNQLVRSATSIGANYMEANQGCSMKDFKNKVRISQKESNESKYWLRMIAAANSDRKEECRKLWQEAHELTLIFAKISKTCEEKNKK